MVYKLLFWIDGVDYSSTHFAARFSRPLTEGGKGAILPSRARGGDGFCG